MNLPTDIDIDVADRAVVLPLFDHCIASMITDTSNKKHNTGVYFHSIPSDPLTGRCTIDYKKAEEMGYFKIDILNVNIYKDVRDNEHLDALMEQEPNWDLFQEEEFCNMLFHLNGHHSVCQTMNPRSVPQLAAVLAMIRPAKRHLIGKSWDEVNESIWDQTDDAYSFKKSHAHGYSLAVTMHANLLVEQLSGLTD